MVRVVADQCGHQIDRIFRRQLLAILVGKSLCRCIFEKQSFESLPIIQSQFYSPGSQRNLHDVFAVNGNFEIYGIVIYFGSEILIVDNLTNFFSAIGINNLRQSRRFVGSAPVGGLRCC